VFCIYFEQSKSLKAKAKRIRGELPHKKNMNLYTDSDEKEMEDSWLPCCEGGFSDLNYEDSRTFKSAKGIFDCTCFNVPTKAQFPR
jgi:hypothetical protein